MNKDVLLFSGGLDSYIAYFYLNKPMCLFIDLKHKYADVERDTIQRLQPYMKNSIVCEEKALDLGKWEKFDSIIPLRNIYMSMIATNYGDKIWIVGVEGDHTQDKSPQAFEKISDFLTYFCERPIKVDSPFWSMTKTEHVAWYVKNGYSIPELLKTYSCFSPSGHHCGHCPSCFRRWIAMFNNDIYEKYQSNPLDWDMIPLYIERMKMGYYSKRRAEEFFTALFKADYNVGITNIEWIEKLRHGDK